jgi:large subunit ribosomal protein L9
MQVILLEKIRKLGNLGDTVKVRAGYGRNYLIPGGKAVPATADNVAKFEARRAELEKAQADAYEVATARAEKFKEVAAVTIRRKAGSEGKLYGSVGTMDIAQAVTDTGIELEKHEVKLPDGPLRQTGEYELDLNLHADVDARIRVIVAPEEE